MGKPILSSDSKTLTTDQAPHLPCPCLCCAGHQRVTNLGQELVTGVSQSDQSDNRLGHQPFVVTNGVRTYWVREKLSR